MRHTIQRTVQILVYTTGFLALVTIPQAIALSLGAPITY